MSPRLAFWSYVRKPYPRPTQRWKGDAPVAHLQRHVSNYNLIGDVHPTHLTLRHDRKREP
jgi:hypothetical protein